MSRLLYRITFLKGRAGGYRPNSFYISFVPTKGQDFDLEQSLFWGGIITKAGSATLKLKASGTKNTGATITKAGSASLKLKASGTNSGFTLSETGSASLKLKASGTNSGLTLLGAGSGTLKLNGSGTNTLTISETGSGTLDLKGSGEGFLVITKAGGATLKLKASGSDTVTNTGAKAGSAALKLKGSGTKVHIPATAKAGGATLKLKASGFEIVQAKGGKATLKLTGSGSANQIITKAGRGAIRGRGTGSAYLTDSDGNIDYDTRTIGALAPVPALLDTHLFIIEDPGTANYNVAFSIIKYLVYSQADRDKLAGIEDNATRDQTATEIRDALASLVTTNRLGAASIKDLRNQTALEVRDDLQTLTANARLDASAIKGLLNQSAAEVRDSLASLTGNDRLSQSAIKGLGSAATLDVGTAAGNIVRLNVSDGKLPALDGSNLTNLPAPLIFSVNGQTGEVTLFTDQISERDNLYFTVARVLAALGGFSIDAFLDVDTTTSPPNGGQALVWDGTIWKPGAIVGGGSGVVLSVNGEIGDVIINADEVPETASNKIMTAAERTKLAGIEAGATGDQTATEIRDALQTLTGSSRLDASAIKGLSNQTAEGIRDALQSLVGNDRLDYSAIKGLGTAATKDVGTTAFNVIQLDNVGKLPAVDGSQLTNIDFPVDSVNSQTGAVVLDAGDIAETTTRKWLSDTERTKLTGIEAGATADQTPIEIRNALEGLTGSDRLDASAIEGLELINPTLEDGSILAQKLHQPSLVDLIYSLGISGSVQLEVADKSVLANKLEERSLSELVSNLGFAQLGNTHQYFSSQTSLDPATATFSSYLDTNGIIYRLGTVEYSVSYTNPASTNGSNGLVNIQKVMNGTAYVTGVTDRAATSGGFNDVSVFFGNVVLLVDFRTASYLSPSKFTFNFRIGGASSGGGTGDTLKLQGSTNNSTWFDLTSGLFISHGTAGDNWYSLDVNQNQGYYRYFRLYMTTDRTNLGSSGAGFLNEIEFYGNYVSTNPSYVIQSSDREKVLALGGSNTFTLRVPDNNSNLFPRGWFCFATYQGSATLTVNAVSAATLNTACTLTGIGLNRLLLIINLDGVNSWLVTDITRSTASDTKALLESLTGSNRLDASAIKNIAANIGDKELVAQKLHEPSLQDLLLNLGFTNSATVTNNNITVTGSMLYEYYNFY